ncbi:hypothetical protein [Actinoallomurus iriomotensis]|uniref:hypothetical protein n=1 Tax=Actinoallomurus iriomotensis TaxID=478107 RepID=UPI0025574153|nr:hypothetical protein [Actinoallomurus iriomotensis]
MFVRPAAPEGRYWNDKPPARRFVAAHHDLDRVDRSAEIQRWIRELDGRAGVGSARAGQ